MSAVRETNSSQNSVAEKFLELPLPQRLERIKRLSEAEALALLYDWEFWARPKQLIPPGDWDTWLVMAGRGFGKTRTGAETVRVWIKDNPIVNIIAPTIQDIHKVILEGPAGIMAVCSPAERPKFQSKDSTLTWPNGAKSLLFSAERPERLRGPQCYKLWADELAAWRYVEETWDGAMFGLRLGTNPQAVVTTTPKPNKLVKALRYAERTHFTAGTTYDNNANLAPKFYASIISKYEGTRLGRQELNAELLEDNPGALWTLAGIDADRVKRVPDLQRIVVGVDPATSSEAESDLTGIVVAGIGSSPSGQAWPPHFYVLDDLSLQTSPENWAKLVVGAYDSHHADRVVAEINNGGDLVEAVLRTKDMQLSYQGVHASRGKLTRAEPIAALYEQQRVHHVGTFGPLEDQMCDYVPMVTKKSPDRMDALVWAIWALTEGVEEELTAVYEEDVSISPELDEYDLRQSL